MFGLCVEVRHGGDEVGGGVTAALVVTDEAEVLEFSHSYLFELPEVACGRGASMIFLRLAASRAVTLWVLR